MPEIKSIVYILDLPQARFWQGKRAVAEAYIRSLAKAVKLMKDETAVARDAFFAQMSTKSFGGKTDPRLAQLQWDHWCPYFATSMAISAAGLAGSEDLLPHPELPER